jgi:hypothetical protein
MFHSLTVHLLIGFVLPDLNRKNIINIFFALYAHCQQTMTFGEGANVRWTAHTTRGSTDFAVEEFYFIFPKIAPSN